MSCLHRNIFNQKFLTQVVVENSCNAEVNANSLEAKLRVRIAQSHLLDNGGLLKLKLWSQCHLDSGTVDRMEEIIHASTSKFFPIFDDAIEDNSILFCFRLRSPLKLVRINVL